MKFNFKLSLFAVAATISMFVIACKKENTEPNFSTTITAETQKAFNLHNDYLSFVSKQIESGKVSSKYSATSLEGMKTITKQYFNEKYGQDVSVMIDQAFDTYFKNYRNVSPKIARFGLPQHTANVQKMQDLISSDIAVDEFTAQTNKMLQTNSEETINSGFASVVGVAQGSYTYWKGSNNWNVPYATSQEISPRACNLCLFALADLAGAADGAAAGALLGGVGAGPGAVMGGAIYSGLTALAW